MASSIDILSAKIAILKSKTEFPGDRKINRVLQPGFVDTRKQQHPSLVENEHKICQHIAFISAYSADALHVLAFAVEEASDRRRITIRFAANEGTHPQLKKALRIFADILQDEATDVLRERNQERFLSNVVQFNQDRILCRLRSRRASRSRSNQKPPLIDRLKLASNFLEPSDKAQQLRLKIDNLQTLCDTIEGMSSAAARSTRCRQTVIAVVKQMHDLLTAHREELRQIDARPSWTPEETDALLDRMSKIGQYVVCVEELLRSSRRYRAFSKVNIEFINLQQSGPAISGEMRVALQAVCADNELDKALGDPKIKDALKLTTRVHAEIQLLIFLEQHQIKSRIICSSKSACYLCHHFVRLHDKYVMPSTHGRLYASWRFPRISQGPYKSFGVKNLASSLDRTLSDLSGLLSNVLDNSWVSKNKIHKGLTTESRVDLCSLLSASSMSVSVVENVPKSSVAFSARELERVDSGFVASGSNVASVSDTRLSTRSLTTINEHATVSIQPSDRQYAPESLSPGSDDAAGSIAISVNVDCSDRDVSIDLSAQASATFSFTNETRHLRVQAPGLNVLFEIAQVEKLNHRSERVFRLRLDCISMLDLATMSHDESVIDVLALDHSEMPASDGALLSPNGIILRNGHHLLRFRAEIR